MVTKFDSFEPVNGQPPPSEVMMMMTMTMVMMMMMSTCSLLPVRWENCQTV